MEDKVLGTISLVAFNEEQKQTLCNNTETLIDFVGRMADLISGKIMEREMLKEKIVMAGRLEAVVDTVYEGVMAIDKYGVITHFNRSAERMFGMPKEQLLSQPVQRIFEDMPLLQVLQKGKGFNSVNILLTPVAKGGTF